MSHPNSSHDRESEYPSDNYKPVRKQSYIIKAKVNKRSKMKGPDRLVAMSKALLKKM